MNKIFGFALILLLGSFTLFQPGAWQTIKGDGYTILCPQEWTVDSSGSAGTEYIFFAPTDSAGDMFRENINLIVQDLSGLNLNLDKYTEISIEQIKTLIANSNLISSEKIQEDGLVFQKLFYTGEMGDYALKFAQYYFVHDEKAYVLTLTCPEDTFEKYLKTGEQIMRSFFFTK